MVFFSVVLLIALGVIGRMVVPQTQAQIDSTQETVDARVIEVVEEGLLDQGGMKQPYQKLRLEILSGLSAGETVVRSAPAALREGDRVSVAP